MAKIFLERFCHKSGPAGTAIAASSEMMNPHNPIYRTEDAINTTRKRKRLEQRVFLVFALAALITLLCFGQWQCAYSGEPTGKLTNDDIVKMVQNRMSPNDIIDRINSANPSFDLSTDAVMNMKEKGVPDDVLAAMLVSSVRSPVNSTSLSGNLPARGVTGASLTPPNLSGPVAQGFPGMESLNVPDLSGSDPLGGGLPSLPALPALSGLPSTPNAGGSTNQPMELTPPAPISVPGVQQTQPQSQGFSLPPIEDISAESDFYSMPGTPSEGSGSSAVVRKSAADDGYEEAKNRFQKEIVNVMSEAPEKQTSAVAWMVANQQFTLDFLRETMMKASRPEFEAAAIFSLGRMRDAESIQEIRRRLVNRNHLVRERAAEALAYMEDNDAIAAAEKGLTQRVEPMDGLIRLVGYARLVRASENLGKILSDSTVPANRVAAAWALAQLGRSGTAAWPAMKKALTSDSSPDVRREAARAVSSYHDDKESLTLLETACRRDPEVRKVVIEELANYRESIPFIISIVNLNPDQIAADELETARATLFKLTGEDFNLDGPRWKKWLTDNRSRLGLPLPPGEAAGDGRIPPGMKKGPAHLAGGRPRQVDVRSWGIVADPAEIPLAPEVDDSFPAARASTGMPQIGGAGRLPVPPPTGLVGMGAGASSMYDADDRSPRGGFGGGQAGMGGGLSGMVSPPGSGYGGGGYDDAPAGGGALPGMRLPLPSGLMGSSGGGDDAPPIPVGMGARGPAAGSFGVGEIGGGAMGGMSMPGSGLSGMPTESPEAYEMPGSSFSGGGYESDSPLPSYESSSSPYGSSGGELYGSSYGSSYDSSPVDMYQAGSQIVLPPTEYAPLSLDEYTKADVIEDEVVDARDESTGDLVPDIPYDQMTTLQDLGIPDGDEWERSIVTREESGYAGSTEAREVGDGSDGMESAFGLDGEESSAFEQTATGIPAGVLSPIGSGASSTQTSASVSTEMSVPGSAFVPGSEDANVIAFPGDQSSFGLGEPLFNEYGQPNDAVEASELPPVKPLVLPGIAPSAVQPQVSTEVQQVPDGMGMMLALPREAVQELGSETQALLQQGEFDDYDFDAMGDPVSEAQEIGGSGFGAGEYQVPAQEYGDYSRGYGRMEMFEQDGGFEDDEYQAASGFDDFTGGEEENFAGEYVVEAREVPGSFTSGSGVAGGVAPSAIVTGEPVVRTAPAGESSASPPASSLHLPSRKRRKQPTESAIVSHSVNVAAPVETESVIPPSARIKGADELTEQAIRTRESVLVTGPFKILDEDGRTAAIVMNMDDQLIPVQQDETDMYIQLDEPGFGGMGDGVVEAREVPAPPIRREAQGPKAGGSEVESSPSQTPGRNFRQKK